MIKTGVLIISDRSYRGEREDATGPLLIEHIRSKGWSVSEFNIIPDEKQVIKQTLINLTDQTDIDLIITSGGTGLSPRDVTPDVTAEVCDIAIPGLVEHMRMEGLKYTRHSLLSRAYAGVRGRTLIINLPGSPKGAIQNLSAIDDVLAHAVDLIRESPEAEMGHGSM